MVIPYDTTDGSFEYLYSLYFVQGIANRGYGIGKWANCMRSAEITFWGNVQKCDNNWDTCMANAKTISQGDFIACLIGATAGSGGILTFPATFTCAQVALIAEGLHWKLCNNDYDGCIANAKTDWDTAKKICNANNPPSQGTGG